MCLVIVWEVNVLGDGCLIIVDWEFSLELMFFGGEGVGWIIEKV